MQEFVKYPPTEVLEGSGGPDRPPTRQVPYAMLVKQHAHVVIEEKFDGSELGLSFDNHGEWRWQHRRHQLDPRQLSREFLPLLAWTALHEDALFDRLGTRYVLFGEWLYGKHTLYYDNLPDYFVEYDVYDRESGQFLSTLARQAVLAGSGLTPVPVLYAGPPPQTLEDLLSLMSPSQFKSIRWQERLMREAFWRNLDTAQLLQETELSVFGEGLYVKAESAEATLARYKWVRPQFLNTLRASGTHWQHRPFFPNLLAEKSCTTLNT